MSKFMNGVVYSKNYQDRNKKCKIDAVVENEQVMIHLYGEQEGVFVIRLPYVGLMGYVVRVLDHLIVDKKGINIKVSIYNTSVMDMDDMVTLTKLLVRFYEGLLERKVEYITELKSTLAGIVTITKVKNSNQYNNAKGY